MLNKTKSKVGVIKKNTGVTAENFTNNFKNSL